MKPTIERIRKLLDERAYLGEQGKMPLWRRVIHFWVLVIKSFNKNRGPVRASSLAYTTILSLVPVLAVVVSISTGMLQRNETKSIDVLMNYLVNTVAPQLDLIQTSEGGGKASREAVVQKIKDFINTINSGTLGLTAGILLVFIAISVLSTVENTFNDIWGVTRGRTWSARIVQYWAAITLAPIFILTALGLTSAAQIAQAAKEDPAKREAVAGTNATVLVTNTTTVTMPSGATVLSKDVAEREPNVLKRMIQFLLAAREDRHFPVRFLAQAIGTILPFLVLSIFLMLFYRLMPATRVRWDAAAVGGLVGGGLLQLNNFFSVVYLARVVSYSKIYGSLGAVPIFLLGLYFSWIIILLGAQVAYAFQNRQAYVHEKQAESINQRGREFAAIRLMTYIAQSFFLGQKPPSRQQMSSSIGIPSQLASQVLFALVKSKLLVEVGGDETSYSPARPIEKISVEDVLSALRREQGNDLTTVDDPTRAVLREEYEKIWRAEMHVAGSVTLHDLVTRIASVPRLHHGEGSPVSKMAPAVA